MKYAVLIEAREMADKLRKFKGNLSDKTYEDASYIIDNLATELFDPETVKTLRQAGLW